MAVVDCQSDIHPHLEPLRNYGTAIEATYGTFTSLYLKQHFEIASSIVDRQTQAIQRCRSWPS